jgi:hypothetical protein
MRLETGTETTKLLWPCHANYVSARVMVQLCKELKLLCYVVQFYFMIQTLHA